MDVMLKLVTVTASSDEVITTGIVEESSTTPAEYSRRLRS